MILGQQARQGWAGGLAGGGERLDVLGELRPVVEAAGGHPGPEGGHPGGELRMDQGAVRAFLVVGHGDLPVAALIVAEDAADAELADAVAGDHADG